MVFTNKSKLAHLAASSLTRKPALPPELSGWAQPLSRRDRAPKIRPRKPGGQNFQIALIFMAAVLVQQAFTATYVEGLTKSRKMSVSDGSRKYYVSGNLEKYSNDGSEPDDGVSFDEDKFAY